MSSPDVLFGQLFIDVQLSGIFPDSKTFVDCTPKLAPAAILAQYEARKTEPAFDLNAFVQEYFELPEQVASGYVSDTTLSTTEHINRLWDRLTRPADMPEEFSSRVPLPHPYVVPGGRFREIFYWDSYFTMLGLKEAGRVDLIRGMVDNFAYLIDTVGFIPNGNRTYFMSRSQPPFFAMMVELLDRIEKGERTFTRYLPALEKEYHFWMDGEYDVLPGNPFEKRVVCMPNGEILNRYWDDTPKPRPEAYREEIGLTHDAELTNVESKMLYEHIRAACESGWDFSSRWFADGQTMTTIQAAYMVPVDLNCLLYKLEFALSDAYEEVGRQVESDVMLKRFERRMETMEKYLWNEKEQFYTDFDMKKQRPSDQLTLAGALAMMVHLANIEQCHSMHERLKRDFLQAGGWVTTLKHSTQQWDWPNGWAPLQWLVYEGLQCCLDWFDGNDPEQKIEDFEPFLETAREGRDRWLALNDKVFKATGKMMEKYNVVDGALTTGGGEYPNQDGFGWTNGVYLALSAERDEEQKTN